MHLTCWKWPFLRRLKLQPDRYMFWDHNANIHVLTRKEKVSVTFPVLTVASIHPSLIASSKLVLIFQGSTAIKTQLAKVPTLFP